MPAARGLAVAIVLAATVAQAEPLPPGAIGLTSGVVAGTGADAKRVGGGFYEFGAQASWQPTTTERRWGWTIRWATLFGLMYGGSASHIDTTLRTVTMDLTIGVRVRPWNAVSRYLTLRGGARLLRANEPVPTDDSMTGSRDFVGGVASIGIDQYLSSAMFNLDLGYGMIGGGGPAMITLTVGASFAGP